MLRNTHHGKNCAYCDRVMDRGSVKLQPTRDHVIPRVRGGNAVVISCLQCNGIKGDMMPEQWQVFMALYPRWWTLTKTELRLIRRGEIGNGKVRPYLPRRRIRQGTAPLPPVIVPPELVYGEAV